MEPASKDSVKPSTSPNVDAPRFNFAVGEKCYCFYGWVTPYQAHIVKQLIRDGQPMYRVHYYGWSKNWDEVVPEDRLAKMTPETTQQVEEIWDCAKRDEERKAQKRAAEKSNGGRGKRSRGGL